MEKTRSRSKLTLIQNGHALLSRKLLPTLSHRIFIKIENALALLVRGTQSNTFVVKPDSEPCNISSTNTT